MKSEKDKGYSDIEEHIRERFRNKITQLSAIPFDREAVEHGIAALRAHGCVVSIASDRFDIFFPEGTIQEEMLPRTLDLRYRMLFPDGFEIRSVVRRDSDLHLLMLPRSILPKPLPKPVTSFGDSLDTQQALPGQ